MQLADLRAWHRSQPLAVAGVTGAAAAVEAVRRLQRAGIGNDQLSLLALDPAQAQAAVEALGPLAGHRIHDDETPGVLADEAHPKGRDELEGALVGGGLGLLMGLSLFAVPGVGAALLAAGPVVMALNVLAHGLWGGVGVGMLVGAIFDDRVSEGRRDDFQARLEAGEWLLIVHGDAATVERAAAAVRGEGVTRVEAF